MYAISVMKGYECNASWSPLTSFGIYCYDDRVARRADDLASASIYTNPAEEGEEAAIAPAVASTTAKAIVSDFKTAIRNHEIGRISNTALRILLAVQATRMRNVHIIWTPAHASLPGNELYRSFWKER